MRACLGDSADEIFNKCLKSTDYNIIRRKMCLMGPDALSPVEKDKGWNCFVKEEKFKKCLHKMEEEERKRKLEANKKKPKSG